MLSGSARRASNGWRNSCRSTARASCLRWPWTTAWCSPNRWPSSSISMRRIATRRAAAAGAVGCARVWRALAQAITCDVHPLRQPACVLQVSRAHDLRQDKAARDTWAAGTGCGLGFDCASSAGWVRDGAAGRFCHVRCADHGGCVLGSSGVQRAALCTGSRSLSAHRRDRCRLPRAAGFPGSRAGTPGLSNAER